MGHVHGDDCRLPSADTARVFLGTVRARRESLRKLDLLLNVLNSFRKVLLTEAQLITDYERAEKREKSSKKTAKPVAEGGFKRKPALAGTQQFNPDVTDV